MGAIVAAALVVVLVAYETVYAFREYREGKAGAGVLVTKIVLIFLAAYLLVNALVELEVLRITG